MSSRPRDNRPGCRSTRNSNTGKQHRKAAEATPRPSHTVPREAVSRGHDPLAPSEISLSEQNAPASNPGPAGEPAAARFRPSAVAAVRLDSIGEAIGVPVPGASADVSVTGISLNSRTVERGDLYVALPGAARHG